MTALADLSKGDRITASARNAPMTVAEARPTATGKGTKVVAENRAGRYAFLSYPWEEGVLMLVGDDTTVVGEVEVERVDE